jgi:hypothetical protein
MRVLSRFSLLLAMTGLAIACSSSPTAPAKPTTVTLAPGQSASVGGLTVSFDRVTADSRCPGDALCVTAGDASVAVRTRWFGSTSAAELWLFDTSRKTLARGGHSVTFDTLSPYPFLSNPIAPGDYRATFIIQSAADR